MGEFIVPLLGGFLGFLLGFAFSVPTIEKIVQTRRASANTTASNSDGKVMEITGKILSEARSLHSPLTRTACVLWHVEVLENKSSFENSRWITVFSETSAHPFDIDDGIGIVRVYPQSAELILRDDFYRESGPFATSFEPELKGAVEKLVPFSLNNIEHPIPLQLREQILKTDEMVSILGRIQEKDGGRVISASNDGSPFSISDGGRVTRLATLYWRLLSSIVLFTALGVFLARVVANSR